jgi:hypothetical protein
VPDDLPSPSDVSVPQCGDRRWPIVAAALAAGIMNQLLPGSFRLSPHWVYPVFLVGFLVLIAGDPGFINRERRWLRPTTEVMIALITLANAVSAVRLVADILTRGFFDTAGRLLGIGAVVWLTNVITFALWYWDLDGGGSAARAVHGARHNPALVFPEMTLPELACALVSAVRGLPGVLLQHGNHVRAADVSAIKR